MSIRTELNQAYWAAQRKRDSLTQSKIKALAKAYGLIYSNENAKRIADELLHKTINFEPLPKASKRAIVSAISKAKAKQKQVEPAILDVFVISLFERLSSKVDSDIIEEIKGEQDGIKPRIIDDNLERNRKEKNVYYIASTHKDSAEDHEPYQGKIYIDAYWSNCIHDPKERARIKSYNARHKVRTMQWVIGKPVYFVTRPYCRHYFESVPTKEVMKSSVKGIIDNHHAEHEVGERGVIQTPKTKRIKDVIKFYEERLQLHEAMFKRHPTDKLRRAMDKDRILIKKWKRTLKLQNNRP